MGKISGEVIARCKLCDCKFTWHVNSIPFPDSEVIGTCSNCIQEKSHDCLDETYDPFRKVGKKVFARNERVLVVRMKGHLSEINRYCEEIGEISNKYVLDVEFY